MKGVLFDTSIWIEYFKANPDYFPTCQTLLDKRSVWTLDIIFGELVQGAKGNRELELLDIFHQNTPKIQSPDLPSHAGILSQKHQLLNQGIGLIDSIIMLACLENGLKLWTLDKKIIRFFKTDFSSFLYSNL